MPPKKAKQQDVTSAGSDTVTAVTLPETNGHNRSAPDANIALRAWWIWQEEGCPPNCEMEHWLRAERELAAK